MIFTINPVLFGILATIVSETVAFVIFSIVMIIKVEKRENKK